MAGAQGARGAAGGICRSPGWRGASAEGPGAGGGPAAGVEAGGPGWLRDPVFRLLQGAGPDVQVLILEGDTDDGSERICVCPGLAAAGASPVRGYRPLGVRQGSGGGRCGDRGAGDRCDYRPPSLFLVPLVEVPGR